jgi:hypothetical protein
LIQKERLRFEQQIHGLKPSEDLTKFLEDQIKEDKITIEMAKEVI